MNNESISLEEILRGGLTLGTEQNPSYYRVEVIASLFGVSVRRVQQLTQEGIIQTIKTKEGRRYDLGPTVQQYIKYLSDKAYGKEQNSRETKLREQKLEAEIALKESQGELHRIRTSIATGEYISIEEVQVDYAKFFVVFKKFALSIPSRIAGQVSAFVEPVQARAIEKDLTNEITSILRAFVVAGKVDGEGGETSVEEK